MAGAAAGDGRGWLLSEAVEEIRLKAAEDARRRRELTARRQAIRRLDYWLNDVESMLEEDRRTVPEPLVREISVFLRSVDPKLQRSLLRNRAREASRVLDVLFDAQEALLPRVAESVA
jgi:hypothetical protein